MHMLLIWVGRLAGMHGAVMGGAAVLARRMGHWHIGSNLQVGTLLQAGIAAMVLGALAYAAAIAEREHR
jgi:hypothetical protein